MRHKLIFSFLIAAKIRKHTKELTDSEWNFFLRGILSEEGLPQLNNPNPKMITNKSWKLVRALPGIHINYDGLAFDISENIKTWTEWISAKDPQSLPLPLKWENTLTIFQKMLILKCFRDEKTIFKMTDFVEETLGHPFAHPMPTTMDQIFKQSDSKTPIIFVLSQGADPANAIMKHANTTRGGGEGESSKVLKMISLGEGQGEPARRAIGMGKKTGNWVLLANCHLAKSWMPNLNAEVSRLVEGKYIKNNQETLDKPTDTMFRLILTSMPSNFFPTYILQNSVKVTIEPPKGIKANLMNNMNLMTEEQMEDCKKPTEFKKFVFSLAFFHAVLVERKKYGALGWNKMYEFNESDLETGFVILKNLLNQTADIPYDSMNFVIGEITWGGRVTDDLDRRCLKKILQLFLNEDVVLENYSYTESGIYMIPADNSLVGYHNYIKNLPDNDDPSIFGMNDNANITFQKQESDFLLSTLIRVQPTTRSSDGGRSPEEELLELIIQIQKDMPDEITSAEFAKILFDKIRGNINSLTTFVMQEMERFNKLIGVLNKSLKDVSKAMKGELAMSYNLEQMYKSLLNNKVPEVWIEASYPSLRPLGAWVKDCFERIEFIRYWLMRGQMKGFWLPCFFFPQGFLTAVLQNYSRKFQVAIDELSFTYEFQKSYNIKELKESAGDGVFIYGMFFQAAEFDITNMSMGDSKPGETYSTCPIIKFTPVRRHKPNEQDYACPMYKTPERAGELSTTGHSTNFIGCVEIPTQVRYEYWVLKGAALLSEKLE